LAARRRTGDSDRVRTVLMRWGFVATNSSALSELPRNRRSEILVRGRRAGRVLMPTVYGRVVDFGHYFSKNRLVSLFAPYTVGMEENSTFSDLGKQIFSTSARKNRAHLRPAQTPFLFLPFPALILSMPISPDSLPPHRHDAKAP
jgi:hypothetical protein